MSVDSKCEHVDRMFLRPFFGKGISFVWCAGSKSDHLNALNVCLVSKSEENNSDWLALTGVLT